MKRGTDGSSSARASPITFKKARNESQANSDDVIIRPRSLAVGTRIEALDVQELWYPACIEEANGKVVRVSFDGWGSDWDEWLPKSSPRLREHRGWGTPQRADDWQQGSWIEALDMEGKWYKAKVLYVSETAAMVHYQAWSSKWDEWVDKTSGRLRPLGAGRAANAESGGAKGKQSAQHRQSQLLAAQASRHEHHEDLCAVCEEPGELICCDGRCKRVFHVKCLPANNPAPESDSERWVCADCRCKRFRCFVCKRWGAARHSVHCCGRKNCGKYFHAECLMASLQCFPSAALPPFPDPASKTGGQADGAAKAEQADTKTVSVARSSSSKNDEEEDEDEEGADGECDDEMEEVNVSDDAVGDVGKADAEQHSEENEPPTDALADSWLSRGHRWVGRRVRRFFDVSDGFLDGTIARWLPASGDDAALWHVVHDDGDEEDLEAYEVRAALIALEKKWKKEPSEEEVQRALDALDDQAADEWQTGACEDDDGDDEATQRVPKSSPDKTSPLASSLPGTPTKAKVATAAADTSVDARSAQPLFGRARGGMIWSGITCARHWCVVCNEPESAAYGRAMLACVRCTTAVHRVCASQLAHTPVTPRSFLCVRCSECTPRGLNAPDPVMPAGTPGGKIDNAQELPEFSTYEDEKHAGISFASLANGFAAVGGKGASGKGTREFEPPDEVVEALRNNEILPSRDFAPPPYAVLRRSVYRHKGPRERLPEDDVMVCSCTPETGGCEERCQNRALQHECNPSTCACGEACANRPLSTLPPVAQLPLQLFKTFNKGWGVKTTKFLNEGDLVVEYVGEVIDMDSWEARKRQLGRFEHMYFMALNSEEIVDASRKGNIARFINHSCSPNLQVEKWYVNRTPRLAMWAKRPIAPGEELTYNYSVKWTGNLDHAQQCFCGSPNCTGYLGRPPKK